MFESTASILILTLARLIPPFPCAPAPPISLLNANANPISQFYSLFSSQSPFTFVLPESLTHNDSYHVRNSLSHPVPSHCRSETFSFYSSPISAQNSLSQSPNQSPILMSP